VSAYFKAVPPSGVTRGTLDWNVPTGTVIRCDHNVTTPDHGDVCPRREGDGISIAKTWRGAGLAGHPTGRCCTVAIDPADILAEDGHKIRVRAATVGDWYDAAELLRQGWGARANLAGADLFGADLSGADLSEAYLSRANLSGADLSGANLYRADLFGADLSRTDLSRVNLSGAYLSGADLFGAYLFGADLSRADLSGANLYRANLSRANLYRANLSRANLGDWERGPDGYAQRKAEVTR
jgi:hypothetical protein